MSAAAALASTSRASGPVPCRYVDGAGVPTSGLLDAIEDWRAEEIGTDTLLAVVGGWRHGVEECVELEPDYRVTIESVAETVTVD